MQFLNFRINFKNDHTKIKKIVESTNLVCLGVPLSYVIY